VDDEDVVANRGTPGNDGGKNAGRFDLKLMEDDDIDEINVG